MTNSLDDLELELRKLPGVKAAGFDEREDMLLVQLHLGDRVDAPEHPVPIDASRIVARHIEERTAVEIVRWRTIPTPAGPTPAGPTPAGAAPLAPVAPVPPDLTPPPAPAPAPVAAPATAEAATDETSGGRRARLLAVLAFPDTDELEVHLILDGRRTIGRSSSSEGLLGAVEATLGAVRELGASFEPTALWARELESDEDERTVVAVALGSVVVDAANDYGIAAGASAIDAAARSTLDALNRRLAQVL
jgi:hypothetical protein